MGVLRNFFVTRKSLGYKLLLAFSLMSVIPLLVVAYFMTTYVFPQANEDMMRTTAIFIMFALWISWAGYMFAKKIVLPVIELAVEAQIIADGEYGSKLSVKGDDELGAIAGAVNTMTDKMRGYLTELQRYSEETSELNVKIHRKVLTLTNLMGLGDIIASGAKFEEIANFAAERLSGEMYGAFSAVFIKEEQHKYSPQAFIDRSGKKVDVEALIAVVSDLEKMYTSKEYLVIDSKKLDESWQKKAREKLSQVNLIIYPVKLKGDVIGVIVLGNFESEIVFNDEDMEVVRAFGKEILLGYQNAEVIAKAKSLEVVDTLTGLYTLAYLEDRLEDEINRAVYYQRPCSLIIINIDNFKEIYTTLGSNKAKSVLKKVAGLLTSAVPAVGKVARSDDEFGILLPEKNKRESLEIAEEIREKIENMDVLPGGEKITASLGVGENPIDGANAKQIMTKARGYVKKAEESGKNKVVGW